MLGALGATGVVGLAGCANGGQTPTGTATASGATGTVKIGAIQPLSGDLQYYGQQSMWGFYSGFGFKAGMGGDALPEATTGTKTMTVGNVDYELVVKDTVTSAGVKAQERAETLVTDDGVDLLFGTTLSSSAQQVIKNVTKQAGVLTLIGPAASAGITSSSDTCGRNVFRASENTAMDARSGGKYVANNTDISKVYLFGADYSFGHAVVRNYEQILTENGIEIVGKKFVPRGYKQWDGLLDNAESAGAEGIVAGFTVVTLPALFRAFLGGDYSFRVIGGMPTRIGIGIAGDILIEQYGEPLTQDALDNSGLGPFTTRYHWNQYDNDINSTFVDMYSTAYGSLPDLFTSGTFAAASSIVQAVEAAGSTAPKDIRSQLRGMTIAETPKGTDAYTYQTYNNQARSPMTIVDLAVSDEENWQAAVKPSRPIGRVPAGETTIPKDGEGMNCSL